MNEKYEQFVMPHVRDRLLAQWMVDVKELISMPFSDYTRLYRNILCIRLAELITSGYDYLQHRVKELENENIDAHFIKFYARLKNGVQQFADSIPDDEFMYLYNLRNHASRIFVMGYDIIDLDGNIIEGKTIRLPTKNGRQSFAVEMLQNMFNETIKRFNNSDEAFVEYIYHKAQPIFSSMFEDLTSIFYENN